MWSERVRGRAGGGVEFLDGVGQGKRMGKRERRGSMG